VGILLPLPVISSAFLQDPVIFPRLSCAILLDPVAGIIDLGKNGILIFINILDFYYRTCSAGLYIIN
jgi:hypothetical protein